MFVEFASLVAGYLLTWPALVGFLLLGVIFEHRGASRWAVFAGLVSMAISYFYFDITLENIAFCAVAYLVVGLVWSFWRYKRFVADSVEYIKARNYRNDFDRNNAYENLHPSRNLSAITSWIIIWPFSAIENILGDVITAIQALVTKVFKSVYQKIYEKAISGLIVAPKVDD
jgi:hypothetical protein